MAKHDSAGPTHGRSKAEAEALLDGKGRKRLIAGQSCSECGRTLPAPMTHNGTFPQAHSPTCGRKSDPITV